MPVKMKRKDLEEFNHEFSDFSLSSPARKIRRLDAELLPVVEEEDMEISISEHSVPDTSFRDNVGAVGGGAAGRGVVIEELPNENENEERAIVVFKPMSSPLVSSPSSFSVTINPQFISGLKTKVLWSHQSNLFGGAEEEAVERDKYSGKTDNCMAVVPWVPSQLPAAAGMQVPFQNDPSGMMDAEEMETSTMDVEEDGNVTENNPGGINLDEGRHQWQQLHCMVPQPPHYTSTPVVWYR